MLTMVAGGMMVAMVSLFVILAPQETQATTPLRVTVELRTDTVRTVVGYSQHHLLVEALASASISLAQPFSYSITEARMRPKQMFGAENGDHGFWRITLNGILVDNLHNISIQHDDRIIVERQPLP